VDNFLHPWLSGHLQYKEALQAGRKIMQFVELDNLLACGAVLMGWQGLTNWCVRVDNTDFANVTIIKPSEALLIEDMASPDPVTGVGWINVKRSISNLRTRIRLLLIIAEGLEKSPVHIETGEQEPRKSPRYIVHPPQTHADALAEFAGKLVDPPGKFVAQVRRPQAYHEVKLRPDLDSEAQSGGPSPDPAQPDDIRRRSRAVCDASEHQATVIPLVQPEQPPPRRATRRPRPQEPEQERRWE
jgi:hypothetical protein